MQKSPNISVVIPTFNRFKYLLSAIESVKTQSLPAFEIIVVNDASTQSEYYQYDFSQIADNIRVIHLTQNSKSIFGFACPGGYQRNFGIYEAKGDYIAFLDDDDIWMPNKLELQIRAIRENPGCEMSCTDAWLGSGPFDTRKTYQKYNQEVYFNDIRNIHLRANSTYMNHDFPTIWNKSFLQIHNTCICSSVLISANIIRKTGWFISFRHSEDYQYWLRALNYTNCVYVKEPCVYYDADHGDGQYYG